MEGASERVYALNRRSGNVLHAGCEALAAGDVFVIDIMLNANGQTYETLRGFSETLDLPHHDRVRQPDYLALTSLNR